MTRALPSLLLLALLAAGQASAAAPTKARKPQVDSLRGEVVDLAGYLVDKERIGEAYADAAHDVIANGHPAGILSNDGVLYLALGKDFKSPNDLLASYAGKKVKVTGKKIHRAKMAGFVIEHIEEMPPPKARPKKKG